MIRSRCAACGDPINRTDQLFEDSNGIQCASCLRRQGADALRRLPAGIAAPPPPAWSILPELAVPRLPQG
ncbi:MAG: hypothetical protein KKA55_13485 [Proteobacteria bacterium]|nr:hypothetical protein [Pseudomonadota bacterium]MBU1596531.1 hypothetical protein [Pseudomonadota bacterium]